MKKSYSLIQSILFILFCSSITAQPGNANFTSSGTYIVPSGYSAVVTIECWGAGGGGGTAGNGGKGGGGGGAYARITGSILIPGSYAVTVGTGGTAGVNGGNSSFTMLCIAGGGSGSTGTTSGAGGTVITGTGFSGGAGAATSTNDGGGGGGSATNSANGGNGAVTAGGIGQGNGGAGGIANNGNGNDGSIPGGGGGGRAGPGVGSGNSGLGAAGQVIVTVTSVLAIKITYLNAEKGSGFNTLNWQANCSSSQAIFDVQRSADGRTFTSVNTITASRLRCLQPFSYVDNRITAAGNLFYRLRITDIDGSITYSSVIKVANGQTDLQFLGIWPNPVSDAAQLNIISNKKYNMELQIIALDGKVVQRNIIQLLPGSNINYLDMPAIQKGSYLIRGTLSDGQIRSIKFIKQ